MTSYEEEILAVLEEGACRHAWRYYVDMGARAVRSRRCEHCGVTSPLLAVRTPRREAAIA